MISGAYDVCMEHIILPITLNNETREIEFTVIEENRFVNWNAFAGHIGHGTKSHRVVVTAFKCSKTGEIKLTGVALNKQARITSFRDTVSENAKSQHNGTKIKKVGK
jgi:hypothetical protein